MSGIQALAERVDLHHRSGGTLETLPEAINAELLHVAGGPKIMGMAAVDSVHDVAVVTINERVTADAGLYRTTLAHECAHVLLGDGGYCSTNGSTGGEELDAWMGTALVLVPTYRAMAALAGEQTPEDVAEAVGAPLPLVYVRMALHTLAHGGQGSLEASLALLRALLDFRAWLREAQERCGMAPLPADCYD